MRHALAACLVLGSLLALTWLELRAKTKLLAEATMARIEGTIAQRRYTASVLAARARLAIAELRRHDEDPEMGDHVRLMLWRIEEALR